MSWFPYACLAMFAQYGSYIEKYVTPATVSLPSLFAKASSVYNPILYTLNNKDCKKFLKKKFFKR